MTRLRNCLIGAPKFIIVTAHKPLIPMFNKVKPRLMEITNFDFELKYEPGKNEVDPLDYISRHPISENDQENTEQVISHISHKENAEIRDRIRTDKERSHTKKIYITRYQQ